jgi:hypothetical protein
MNDSTPAITAGAATCDAATLAQRQLGFILWYFKPDGVTPHTRDERIAFLQYGIALRQEKLGESTVVTVEQIDAELLSLWNATHPALCQPALYQA